MSKIIKINDGDKLDILSDKVLEAVKEYTEEYKKIKKQNPSIIWLLNNETEEYFIYANKKYSGELMKFVEEL